MKKIIIVQYTMDSFFKVKEICNSLGLKTYPNTLEEFKDFKSRIVRSLYFWYGRCLKGEETENQVRDTLEKFILGEEVFYIVDAFLDDKDSGDIYFKNEDGISFCKKFVEKNSKVLFTFNSVLKKEEERLEKYMEEKGNCFIIQKDRDSLLSPDCGWWQDNFNEAEFRKKLKIMGIV